MKTENEKTVFEAVEPESETAHETVNAVVIPESEKVEKTLRDSVYISMGVGMITMKKHVKQKTFTAVLALMIVLSLTACNTNTLKAGSAEVPKLSDTDYSDMNNWLSFGGDMSKDVDVFMIYPTVSMSTEDADRPFVRLDSEIMLTAASGWLMGNEELVAESANIYAPLYRQLNAVELDSLNSDTFLSNTNATPRDDIFAAFDYYLTNVNIGERPFILLGQSQGAQLVTELSTTFLGSEKYYKYNKNLIIAYAIGVSVTEDQLALNPNIKFSQNASDTRVLVSWNTTSPDEVATGAYKAFGTWRAGALITNPISWTTDDKPVPAADNKASLVSSPEGAPQMVEAFADAIVDKEHNVLVMTAVDETNYLSMSTKISKFHMYDTAFYFGSIQQNVKDRIAAFKK